MRQLTELTTLSIRVSSVFLDALAVPIAFLLRFRPSCIAKRENFASERFTNLLFSIPLILVIVYAFNRLFKFFCYYWGIVAAVIISLFVSFGVTFLQRRAKNLTIRNGPVLFLSLLVWVGIFFFILSCDTYERVVL